MMEIVATNVGAKCNVDHLCQKNTHQKKKLPLKQKSIYEYPSPTKICYPPLLEEVKKILLKKGPEINSIPFRLRC